MGLRNVAAKTKKKDKKSFMSNVSFNNNKSMPTILNTYPLGHA
tara:strand:- start:106 stop:234 length:129 start_codon:yes stop_codon:yes gene_type:complete